MVFVAVLGLCLSSSILAAGTGIIQGYLKNNLGTPMVPGQVTVVGTDLSADTDRDGFFHLVVPPGQYWIMGHAWGYGKSRRVVVVKEGETSETSLTLTSLVFVPYTGSSLDGATGKGLRSTFEILDTPAKPRKTRENGAFGGYLPRGTYKFRFTPPGYYSETVEGKVPGKTIFGKLKPMPLKGLLGEAVAPPAARGAQLERLGLTELMDKTPLEVKRLKQRRNNFR